MMFLFKVLFLINLFVNSLTYPSTERSANDDDQEPSYQEIFPIPIINFLKDNQFNQPNPLNLPNDLNNSPYDFNNNSNIDLHAIPPIKLDENSFIIIHTDHNQYLDLDRINTDNSEKIFILTEFKDSLINKANNLHNSPTNINNSPINNELSTSIKIQHQSNLNLSNINLSLSFSPFLTATTTSLPKLNTTTLNINLTSLNSISTNTINSTINNLNLTSTLTSNATSNITAPKTALTSELISTNIEKPKDLAKNLLLNNSSIRPTNQSIEEINLNKNQLNDELDNNSTIQNNSSYSSYGNDILNVNEFNKINPVSLDLILDSLNDTITDDINSNTTTIG